MLRSPHRVARVDLMAKRLLCYPHRMAQRSLLGLLAGVRSVIDIDIIGPYGYVNLVVGYIYMVSVSGMCSSRVPVSNRMHRIYLIYIYCFHILDI